jgi:hypothetical protein
MSIPNAINIKFSNKPCRELSLNFSVMGRNEKRKKAIVKQETAMIGNRTGTCKYHCMRMPVVKGINNLIEGAFFQSGMFKGFDMRMICRYAVFKLVTSQYH